MAHWSSSWHDYHYYDSFIYGTYMYMNLIHLFWSLSFLVGDVALRRAFQLYINMD